MLIAQAKMLLFKTKVSAIITKHQHCNLAWNLRHCRPQILSFCLCIIVQGVDQRTLMWMDESVHRDRANVGTVIKGILIHTGDGMDEVHRNSQAEH